MKMQILIPWNMAGLKSGTDSSQVISMVFEFTNLRTKLGWGLASDRCPEALASVTDGESVIHVTSHSSGRSESQ